MLESQFKHRCDTVAEALVKADVLLFSTGAGFSADSGLAVYKDIASIDAYRDAGLEYSDICQPEWLEHDPELFYGFWGACFNDYRETQPHQGYDIIRRWQKERFENTTVAAVIKERIQCANRQQSVKERSATEPYEVHGAAGAFYVYTSNVDGHSFDFFGPHEVRECHGNTEMWQCGASQGPCCKRVWRAPTDFSFMVDGATMRAPRAPADAQNTSSVAAEGSETVHSAQAADGGADCNRTCEAARDVTTCSEAGDKEEITASCDGREGGLTKATNGKQKEPPRAGQIRKLYGRRKAPLSNLGDSGTSGTEQCFVTEPGEKWPRCPSCRSRARPAVLMFGDDAWIDNEVQDARWNTWVQAVAETARLAYRGGKGRRLRIVILEIGCGANVQTVRRMTQATTAELVCSQALVLVARVNRDYPLADSAQVNEQHRHIGILSGGLQAMQRIDATWQHLKSTGMHGGSEYEASALVPGPVHDGNAGASARDRSPTDSLPAEPPAAVEAEGTASPPADQEHPASKRRRCNEVQEESVESSSNKV